MAVDKLVDSTQLNSDLTSIANAIRAKSGGSGQLAFPAGFVSEIGNIPSGGGSADEADINDVCFWDYDGSLLYSYSAAEFASLSALPANPSHNNLTAQGWNWSLSDAKTFVSENGFLDIGQLYVTTDGKTHIHIVVSDRRYVKITLIGSASGNITIDWGDESPTQTNSGTSSTAYEHTYAAAGSYDITLAVSTGLCTIKELTAYDMGIYRSINIGTGIKLDNNCFNKTYMMKNASFPLSCDVSTFGGSYLGIECFIFPSAALTAERALNYCTMKAICFPKQSNIYAGYGTFGSNMSLIRVSPTVGRNGYGWPVQVFLGCRSIRNFRITDGVTGFGNANDVHNLNSLKSVTIPSSISTIPNNSFTEVYCLKDVHMKKTTPPTLSGTSVFTNKPADFVIYVPYSADQSILNAYKAASNWSSFSSYMQEESQ